MSSSLKSIKLQYKKNDTKTNISLFITFLLGLGYLVNKQYDSIIILFLVCLGAYLITKNLFYSLVSGILITNLFFTDTTTKEGMKNKNLKENMNHGKNKKIIENMGYEKDKKDKKDIKDIKDKKDKKDKKD
tara:strand:+ start:357 stop:749 length:393 start_codon:yes stop_codon:yes gene_type:complete